MLEIKFGPNEHVVFCTGTGTGSQIETHAKPVPVAWVCGCGVATPSKKGTPRQVHVTTITPGKPAPILSLPTSPSLFTIIVPSPALLCYFLLILLCYLAIYIIIYSVNLIYIFIVIKQTHG